MSPPFKTLENKKPCSLDDFDSGALAGSMHFSTHRYVSDALKEEGNKI